MTSMTEPEQTASSFLKTDSLGRLHTGRERGSDCVDHQTIGNWPRVAAFAVQHRVGRLVILKSRRASDTP